MIEDFKQEIDYIWTEQSTQSPKLEKMPIYQNHMLLNNETMNKIIDIEIESPKSKMKSPGQVKI